MNVDPFDYWRDLLERENLLVPVEPSVEVLVRGPDARRFLNGQLSQNFELLQAGSRVRACLLTPKGKILAAPWCEVDGAGDFQLEVPCGMGDEVVARLDRYLVADQVELEQRKLPERWHLIRSGGGMEIGGRSVFPRFGLPGIDLEETEIDMAHAGPVRELTQQESECLRMALGQAGHAGELAEEPFPAECGLDRTAVDFHKGCYLGQEVVSRLQSVGQVRRRLVRLVASSENEGGAVGSILWDGDGTEVGRITSWTGNEVVGAAHGLAYVKTGSDYSGMRLQASPGENSPVRVLSLFPAL